MLLPTDLETNLQHVRARIAHAARVAGRAPADVTIVAATKYARVETVAALAAAGVDAFGENRLEAFAARRTALAPLHGLPLTWHFIGRLQSRKSRQLAECADCIETLCTLSAARQMQAASDEGMALPRLFVQVNTATDPAKAGVAPDELAAFLDALPHALSIDGLMTMPALAFDPERSRTAFASLRELAVDMRRKFAGRHELSALSMGTSQDFSVAVEEGATHVRLGRILYGQPE